MPTFGCIGELQDTHTDHTQLVGAGVFPNEGMEGMLVPRSERAFREA